MEPVSYRDLIDGKITSKDELYNYIDGLISNNTQNIFDKEHNLYYSLIYLKKLIELENESKSHAEMRKALSFVVFPYDRKLFNLSCDTFGCDDAICQFRDLYQNMVKDYPDDFTNLAEELKRQDFRLTDIAKINIGIYNIIYEKIKKGNMNLASYFFKGFDTISDKMDSICMEKTEELKRKIQNYTCLAEINLEDDECSEKTIETYKMASKLLKMFQQDDIFREIYCLLVKPNPTLNDECKAGGAIYILYSWGKDKDVVGKLKAHFNTPQDCNLTISKNELEYVINDYLKPYLSCFPDKYRDDINDSFEKLSKNPTLSDLIKLKMKLYKIEFIEFDPKKSNKRDNRCNISNIYTIVCVERKAQKAQQPPVPQPPKSSLNPQAPVFMPRSQRHVPVSAPKLRRPPSIPVPPAQPAPEPQQASVPPAQPAPGAQRAPVPPAQPAPEPQQAPPPPAQPSMLSTVASTLATAASSVGRLFTGPARQEDEPSDDESSVASDEPAPDDNPQIFDNDIFEDMSLEKPKVYGGLPVLAAPILKYAIASKVGMPSYKKLPTVSVKDVEYYTRKAKEDIKNKYLREKNKLNIVESKINDRLRDIDVEPIKIKNPVIPLKKETLLVSGGYNLLANKLLVALFIICLILIIYGIYIYRKPSLDGSWSGNSRDLRIKHNRFTNYLELKFENINSGKYLTDWNLYNDKNTKIIYNPNDKSIEVIDGLNLFKMYKD